MYASYIQAEYINYLTEKVCGSMNTDIHKCFIAFFFKLKLSNKLDVICCLTAILEVIFNRTITQGV